MINVITELSKYVILTLMIVYTFHCFYMVWRQDEEEKRELLHQQLTMIFFIDFTAFLVIYLKSMDFRVILFYIEMMIFFAAIQILYRIIYQNASLLLLNNMCMLLSVGFIMLCRLSLPSATKQLLIVAAGSAVSLVIPVMIRKMKFLKDLTWAYAGIGIVLLAAVLVLASTSYGAKLSLMGIQPSEVIKITFVFFMASLLCTKVDFRKVVLATIVAVIHVGILVLSRDLGSAVIFFVTYLVLIYVATRNPSYLFLGLGGGCVGSVIAYHLFGHAICLILVCTSFFLMIVTIALKIRNPFYKLIALGLGTEYAFQVFLTIGGATKFIPMTGVTLPLVSYGGSSVMCTILMLAIIQGLYILREDEDEQIETQRKETIERRGKRATPERKRNRQTP